MQACSRKVFTTLLLLILLAGSTFSQVYKNASAPLQARVADLLQRMTVEEKAGQLSVIFGWNTYDKQQDSISVNEVFKAKMAKIPVGMLWGAMRADPWTQKTLKTGLTPVLAAKASNALQQYMMVHTRLGIPLFLAEECPHGHMAIGTTVFPTSIGQSSTWDTALVKQMADAIAKEVRLQGAHIAYGPVIDLCRELRWSRVEETYGEDPVLSGDMAYAMVSGFQGNSLHTGVISTVKHLVAYGTPDGGHNGGGSSIGPRELEQSYLPSFKKAVDAGALSIMTAYNSIDGIPCTANAYLLKTMLRDRWGFKGFFVSDLGSVEGLMTSHHVVDSPEAAAAMAINAGVDVDLSDYKYGEALIAAVKSGDVSAAVLDSAVARVLRLKFEMGLFENPYVDPQLARSVRNASNIQLAKKIAQESIVLLKNENNLLPLSKKAKRIVVIGPNADNIYNQLGDYTSPQDPNNIITVLKGIQQKVSPSTKVEYVKGCAIRDTSWFDVDAAVKAAKSADVAVVVLGGSSARDFNTEFQETGAAKISATHVSDMESGEGFDRSSLSLMGRQLQLLQAIITTGTPVAVVLIEGRPLLLNAPFDKAGAILNAWYPGQEGGHAIADVLFGDYNPAGRLSVSIPLSEGQLPVYYNHKRPEPGNYVESSARPKYCFGYGLSYAKFDYSDLHIVVKDPATVNVSFTVRNISSVSGDEVPQLYLVDKTSSVVMPVKQLKHYARVHFNAGENKKIEFTLTPADMQLLNQQMQWVVEPGEFTVQIGASSDDIKLNGSFIIH